MQPDIIEGTVIEVHGGSTIDVAVRRTAEHNRLDYGARERVRMTMTQGAGVGHGSGSVPERVTEALAGRRVKVRVHARDHDNLVIGDVEVIG